MAYLRDIRKEKKISQQKVACLSKISLRTLTRWEKENKIPNEEKILKLAEIYGVTPNDLLGVEEKKEGE